MMPQLLTVRVNRPDGRPIRIWIPVLPVVLILSPILLLALLGAVVAGRIYGVSMPRALAAGWRVVCALPGTRLHLDDGQLGLFIAIR